MVICVHDVLDIKQGDLLVVEDPATLCCGGVKFENDYRHYDSVDFESYNTVENPTLLIQRKVLIDGIESISKSVFFSQRNGLVPSDLVRDNLAVFLESMGISKQFFK